MLLHIYIAPYYTKNFVILMSGAAIALSRGSAPVAELIQEREVCKRPHGDARRTVQPRATLLAVLGT